MRSGITIDTAEAQRMLTSLQQRADKTGEVAESVARRTRVTGIPVDTGRLASSPRVVRTREGAEIVSDVPYARFVFSGTRYVPARPPRINAPDLAEAVVRDLFA